MAPPGATPDLAGWIIGAGALVVALASIGRFVARPLIRLFRKAETIADAWHGEPARDGLPARAGVIDRLIAIEQQIKVNGTGLPLGEAVARVYKGQGRLEEKAEALERGRRENAAGIAELKAGQDDARLAAEEARDVAQAVDQRLTGLVEEGQVREQAYLASLREVHGIDLEPEPDPQARTRSDDPEESR